MNDKPSKEARDLVRRRCTCYEGEYIENSCQRCTAQAEEIDAFAEARVAEAVKAEREAMLAWFEHLGRTLTANEVRECIRARGGKT
jgi:hypothetical protein